VFIGGNAAYFVTNGHNFRSNDGMQHSESSLAFTPATHREVLRFIWHYVRRHRAILIWLAICLTLQIALELWQPFFYKEAVDTIATHGAGDRESLRFAMLMVLGGVAVALGHNTFHEIGNRMLSWVETRVMTRAHADVFAHVQRLSTQFHVNSFAGGTSRKIGRGADAIENILDHIWFNFLPLILEVIGFMIVLSLYAPLIGVTIIIGMAVFIPSSIAINLYHAKFHIWTNEQDTRVTASLVDAITGNPTVKAFGAENLEDERHGTVLRELQRRLWQTWRLGQIIGWCHNTLLILLECAVMLLAVWLWYRGEFTAGGFIIVIFYIGRLWGYMRDIGKNVRTYLRAVAHTQEMVGLYQLPLAIMDEPKATVLRVPRGAIAFRDVTFAYEKAGHSVFQNFSLDIEAGEKVALVGHSGGGKSTLVKLLQRLYDVQSGCITIDGQNIAEITQGSLRRSIGLVPQDPILFHRSLAENIAYGHQHASLASIMDAAKKAHAHEFIERLPMGYETLVGERGIKLSGGERQRVAIARAILANTPILILDEATSSLDSMSEKYIQDALEFLIQGRTTIVIAHRLSTIKKVDRILVIEGGCIVEEGNHNALIRKEGGVYRGFYELQAGGFIGE